jgi:two-component system LytT family response regulator
VLKALIVDDEPKLAEVLALKIRDHLPQLRVVGKAQNISDAERLIQEQAPDLVFLDIRMPGGSGFQLFDRFPQPSFSTIFVTGYDEFALDAFRVSAVDYLLKPVRTQALIEAVQKLEARTKGSDNMALLRHNMQHMGDQETKVAIPGVEVYDFVRVKEIVRLEGDQRYTRIYLQDGRELLSSYHLGKYREMLGPYSFFSPHKSHLINTTHIRRYLAEGTVIMEDGSTVPVSRRKRDEFIQKVVKRS